MSRIGKPIYRVTAQVLISKHHPRRKKSPKQWLAKVTTSPCSEWENCVHYVYAPTEAEAARLGRELGDRLVASIEASLPHEVD